MRGNQYAIGLLGGSAWTPLTLGTKILFWGKVSEISGGHMPNKVTGATDYITVSGSPATFQCPNTAPYIAADTDYIWFKNDETQRTTTTAELIGYDLQRTPVKYLDDSPNTIEEIIILKAGETLTTAEKNHLFAYMHLSVLWDNSFNPNGYIKSNRAGSQVLWPGDAATYPFLNKPVGNEYAYVADNGVLDIDITNGFTFACWVKGDAASGGVIQYIAGKLVFGSAAGRYGVFCDTNNKLAWFCQWTTSTAYPHASATVLDGLWHWCVLTYDTVNQRIYFYIDDTLLGNQLTTTQYTQANAFEFYLGAGNANAGAGVSSITKCSIARPVIYPFLLTPTEIADLKVGTYKAGWKARWDLDVYPLVDQTDNYNLTGVNLSSSNIQQAVSIP